MSDFTTYTDTALYAELAGRESTLGLTGMVARLNDREILILDYRDEAGNSRRVLSEHKINADLTDFQRLAYVDWQADTLVLVAPDVQVYRQAGVFHAYITWLRVAQEIDQLGDQHAGSQWRRLALDPDSPSRIRCLEELLAFLERQNVGVSNMSPMDASTVTAYRQIRATRSMFETFLQNGSRRPTAAAIGTERSSATERTDSVVDLARRRGVAIPCGARP